MPPDGHEQLDALATDLGFTESDELRELRQATMRALEEHKDDPEARADALAAYKLAAEEWVEAQLPSSHAPIGYRVAVGTVLLRAGRIDEGLDELWETAYQAGQTPGIESLRETLEAFVATYGETSE